MTETSDDLEATLAHVWATLAYGVEDSAAPARTLALATVGLDGGAEARMVILRSFCAEDATLAIHTDNASHKVGEILLQARGTLLHWDPETKLQIRLRTTLSTREGTAEEWARVPGTSQLAYGGTPPPGRPISAPDAAGRTADPARFAVIDARITEVETLWLRNNGHRRARFQRNAGFTGVWLAP